MLIFLGSPRYWERSVSRNIVFKGEVAKKVDDFQESEVKKWAQHEPNYDNEN